MLLEKITQYHIVFYAMILVAVAGSIGKVVAQMIVKRLVREAGNVHHSNHKLMKLMKAKFEHASMVSDRVQNVQAFADKFLYEYRVWGIKFYSWQNIGKKSIWMVIALGVLSGILHYLQGGMSEDVFRHVAWSGVLTVLLFVQNVLMDETRRIQAIRTYIVDYLENVCIHRYEKLVREQVEAMEEQTVEEMEKEVAAAVAREEEKQPEQEMRIREILQEFLA